MIWSYVFALVFVMSIHRNTEFIFVRILVEKRLVLLRRTDYRTGFSMRCTHAIIVDIPAYVRLDKKTKLDLAVARKQLDDLAGALREVSSHSVLFVIIPSNAVLI